MDKREFIRPYLEYERVPETKSLELQEITETADAWASFFDTHTLRYLQGEPPLIEDFRQAVTDYGQWTLVDLPHTRKELVKQLPERKEEEGSEAARQLSHLTFHEINAVMHNFWLNTVASRNVELPDYMIRDTQTLLAMRAVEKFIAKRKLEAQGDASELQEVYAGQLTEFDTQIILLEIMRRPGNGAIVSLPAPPSIESSEKRHNADFITVDREYQQARGIQAKTFIDTRKSDEYDYARSRVTLIDGSNDLGNTAGGYVRVPNKLGSGTHLKMKWHSTPGLISMDHLERTGVKDIPYTMPSAFGKELMVAKGRARELSRNRKPYIERATDNIEDRLLHDLYDDMDFELPDAS